MGNDSLIKENIESSKLLFTVSIFAVVGTAIITILIFFSGLVSKWAGLDAYALSVIPFIIATLFAAAAAVYGKLSASAGYEEIEKQLLKERKDSAFEVGEDVRFTSARTFQNYETFVPYVLSVLSIIIITVMLVLFYRDWNTRLTVPTPSNSLHVAFICVVLMFSSAFAGAFCIGQSRAKLFRWLRPVGAWLIAAFVVTLLATVSALLYRFGQGSYDRIISRIIFVFFIILDAELMINLIIEFYRPRTIEEVRPVYESRILAIFTEPGGIVRNIADALDYQFGFKVSKTTLYSFMEKALLPLLLLWGVLLWLFTGIVEVKHNEVAFRLRFGRVVNEQPLEPGVYFKLPWPMEELALISCNEIHSVRVGASLEKKGNMEIEPEVILWTKKHYAEERNFLVAVHGSEGEDSALGSLSELGASIPVQYVINKSKVKSYLFNNFDPANMVKKISEQVVTRYFASVDLFKVMSEGREKTTNDLIRQIQATCDLNNLGVTIVAVNIQDVHPQIEKVAPSFHDVIKAMEEKEAMILTAQAYDIMIIPAAKSQALKIISQSKSYSDNMIRVSAAEAERFSKQLLAYDAMPQIFRLRSYLDFLEQDCTNIRKYIFSKSIAYEIYEINLEEKARLDLLDADLGDVAK